MFTAMTDMDDATEVAWYVWKNDSDERLLKVVEEGTTDGLRTYISSILSQFMKHCYSKQEQVAAYKLERAAIEGRENEALLQVDFSETIRVNTRMRHTLTCSWKFSQIQSKLYRFGLMDQNRN